MFTRIRSRLSNKITLYIAVVLILIFGVVTYLITNYLVEISEQNMIHEIELKAESISKDVRNIFENANIVTSQMALNRELTTYLRDVRTREVITSHPLFSHVQKTLIDIKSSSDIHFIAWIANGQANFFVDHNGYVSDETYNVRLRPWYGPAISSDRVVFTPPYIEWESKKNVLSSILALRDSSGIYGFVAVDISLDSIPDIFDSIELKNEDKYFLIAPDGRYVYHGNEELIMNSELNPEVDALYEFKPFILSESDSLREILYMGRQSFMITHDVGVSGWKIVTIVDKAAINQRIAEQTWWIFAIFTIAFVMSIALISGTVTQSTLPFTVITKYGKAIADGDLSKNIPQVYLDRTDEMGSFARTLQTIVETFRAENVILEERIQEKNDELEAQYRHILENEKVVSLGHLVAGIAHEINTPVGNSLSTSTFMEQETKALIHKYEVGELSKNDFIDFLNLLCESLDILTGSLTRTAKLVKSFKQVAVDQSSERKYTFDMKECLDSVIVSLKHEYKNTNISIENKCDKGIELESYPGAVTQVVTNLILNSLKHGYKEKEMGLIVLDVSNFQEHIVLRYIDDGKGMPISVRDKMFDPFFTTNRGSGSSGLGMHIVYNIVTQRLKGEISCETAPNEGVKFSLLLPKHLDEG